MTINDDLPAAWISQANHTTHLCAEYYKRYHNNYTPGASGKFSVYYQRGEIGVKVWKGGRCEIKDKLKTTHLWKNAVEEFNNLMHIKSCGFTPIPICIKPIKIGAYYRPAIFMQHIKGDIDRYDNFEEHDRKLKILRDDYKIELQDHECHNFIQTDNGVFFIDLDPYYTNSL